MIKRRLISGLAIIIIAVLLLLLLSGRAAEASAGRALIVIDPGHGGEDCGAVGISGVEEAGLNLAVSGYLKQELEGAGFDVILTREGEEALADSKKADMAARRAIMNGSGVDLVVSVHMNKFTDPAVHGPMAFYMQGSEEGERLAKAVIDGITEEIGAPSRLANPGDYYVIRESRPTAVLVECGFLSNAEDERLLQSREHQRSLARGIANGIVAYLSAN